MNFFPPNTILDEEIFTPRNLCPDYVVSHIWEAFILHIRSGALAGEPLAELESGLKQIEYRTIRSLPELRDSVYDSLVVAYLLFMKKYYHLYEEYLASLKK